MKGHSVLWRGSAALAAGRASISAGRLLAAILIGRLAGVEELGAFALLLTLIAIFEWLADFGQTDITIREMTRSASRKAAALAALSTAKKISAVVLLLAMPLAAAALDLAPDMLPASVIGAVGIAAVALAQPSRALVRAELRPWVDVSAELGAFTLFLIITAIAAFHGGSLILLATGYSAFRVAYWLLLKFLAPPTCNDAPRSKVRPLVWQAFPLGVAGLLVAVYDSLGPLLLAHLADLRSVGEFAAAARFAFPVLMIVQAITMAFFPALAEHHGRARARVADMQQGVLEGSLLVAGAMFAGLHGAADFLVQLVASDPGNAADLLRLLAWLVLARAVTTAMSPLIVVGGKQAIGLVLTTISILVQVAAIVLLVPRLGIVGVGWGYLCVELTLGVVPVSLLGLWATGIRLKWLPPICIVAAASVAALAIAATPIDGSLAGGAAAAGLFALILGPVFLWRRLPAPFAEVRS